MSGLAKTKASILKFSRLDPDWIHSHLSQVVPLRKLETHRNTCTNERMQEEMIAGPWQAQH